MIEKPIVVGIDGSHESAKAAALGVRLGEVMGVPCQLVNAVRDSWSAASEEVPFDLVGYNEEVVEARRITLAQALDGVVPDRVLNNLDIRLGNPEQVLQQVALEMAAGLVVLGGKHHPGPNRWLNDSSVHHVIRSLNLPLLVTGPGSTEFTRVLAAVDLSDAAAPTLEMAEQFANTFDAQLWVMHAIDAIRTAPATAAPTQLDVDEIVARTYRRVEAEIWPMVERPNTEKICRCGRAADTINQEVEHWDAGLVVLGSHGRGWTERLLLGSTTEWLLNDLPTSVLVVPVRHG